MINIISKYKLEIILVVLIFILFFILRLPNLTLQPIFADEAIYIRWAQVMRAEPTLRFLPVSDGKTPLFMWVLIPFFKFFEDPLFAGRFLSVLSGFATLLGVIFVGWRFLGKWVGLFAGFLIVVTPYTVFLDRMALVDSMLATFTVWSLGLALLLVNFPRLDLAMVLGYIFGAGLLTKPPGFFNLLVLPSTLLLINWKGKDREKKILKIFGLWIITVIITFTIYNLLRLGPGFDNLSTRNQDYIFAPTELVGRWHDPFIPHFKDLVDWFPKLFTLPVLILTLLGIIFSVWKRNKIVLVILIWALVPLLIQMAFLRTFTTRYIFFSIPPLFIIASWGFIELLNRLGKPFRRYLLTGVMVLILIFTLNFNYKLLFDQQNLPLPNESKRGYFEDWTAGYGLKEIAQFLMDEAKSGQVIVRTDGSFGTLPDGLQIYLDKHWHQNDPEHRIYIVGGKGIISEDLRNTAKDKKVYYVTNRSVNESLPENIEEVKIFPKFKGRDLPQGVIGLYRVLYIDK